MPDYITALLLSLLLFLLLTALAFFIRFLYLKQQQPSLTSSQQVKELNHLLLPYGFQYDVSTDLFYAVRDCWQRQYGYCSLYDDGATPLGMVIDCEPIYFYYEGRRWLMEFWKGQYGMAMGAEMGLYVTDEDDVEIPGIFSGPFFESVTDAEQLPMYFQLRRGRQILLRQKAVHWWLTAFKLGEYSAPEELTMKIKIIFPDLSMRTAFVRGLLDAGYKSSEIHVRGRLAAFTFDRPKSPPPKYRNTFLADIMLNNSRFYCQEYHRLTSGLNNSGERLSFLYQLAPGIFQIALKSLHPEELYSSFLSINRQWTSEEDAHEHFQDSEPTDEYQ